MTNSTYVSRVSCLKITRFSSTRKTQTSIHTYIFFTHQNNHTKKTHFGLSIIYLSINTTIIHSYFMSSLYNQQEHAILQHCLYIISPIVTDSQRFHKQFPQTYNPITNCGQELLEAMIMRFVHISIMLKENFERSLGICDMIGPYVCNA